MSRRQGNALTAANGVFLEVVSCDERGRLSMDGGLKGNLR